RPRKSKRSKRCGLNFFSNRRPAAPVSGLIRRREPRPSVGSPKGGRAGSREPSCTGFWGTVGGSVRGTHWARQRFLTESLATGKRPLGGSGLRARCPGPFEQIGTPAGRSPLG